MCVCIHILISVCVLGGFNRVCLFATLWTVAHQGPLPMEFSRQDYWRGCLALLQRIFLTQGLNPRLMHCRWSPALTGRFFATSPVQMLYHLSHQGSPYNNISESFCCNLKLTQCKLTHANQLYCNFKKTNGRKRSH